MNETGAAHTHLPAVKVGGRRLSASKPKHNPHNVKCVLESPYASDHVHIGANLEVEDFGPVDYPRPSPPPGFVHHDANPSVDTHLHSASNPLETSNPFGNPHNQYEEESPKNEKKNHQQVVNDLEKLSRASQSWESKLPTRDHATQNNPKRIDQPAGKGR